MGENTRNVFAKDRDQYLVEMLENDASHANQLKAIFRDMALLGEEDEGDVMLTREMLDSFLKSDEAPDYLESMEVTEQQVVYVFGLLNVKNTDQVSLTDYIAALTRYGGNSESFDMATLLYDCQRSEV